MGNGWKLKISCCFFLGFLVKIWILGSGKCGVDWKGWICKVWVFATEFEFGFFCELTLNLNFCCVFFFLNSWWNFENLGPESVVLIKRDNFVKFGFWLLNLNLGFLWINVKFDLLLCYFRKVLLICFCVLSCCCFWLFCELWI